MVEISDIKDKDSLKAWLEDQPREVSIWIAARAAARVLPLYWQAVLTEDRARVRDVIALPVLRSVLISSVAALVPTDDIRSASYAYVHIVRDVATNAALNDAAFLAAAAAVNATSAAAADANRVHTDSAYAAADAFAAAADAAAEACAESPVWQTFRRDAERVADADVPDALSLWLDGPGPLADKWAQIKAPVEATPDFADWQFWIDWYEAQLAGRTMLPDPARTLEMLEKIALIDPATWAAGPEVVNPKIRKIWEAYKDGSSSAGHAADPEPVSENAKSAMKQRVAINRDALVVASAGIIDQLGVYREQVRGMNHLEPDLRDEVLAFIDEFTGKLSDLIQGLPASGTVDDDQAGRLVLWLREYRGLLNHKLAYYGSAENMAEATVPTGIILGATGIGAMLGMPVAGSVVGGLIVNQMKPGQAARELTKPSGKDTDLP